MSVVPSKYFLDTNVLLDLATSDREFHKDAAGMLLLGENRGDEFIACISSLKDVYFIMLRRYERSEPIVRSIVKEMAECFTMVDLTRDLALKALASDEPDYEDGIIRECAERAGCAAIVSRDIKAFLNSPIPRTEPKDF